MSFIYHGVPEPMVGDKLIPLNSMQGDMAQLRVMHLEKYKGREEILEKRIPLLDCLWNDVVQFLPLHPQKVFDLQVELGIIPTVPPYKFFEINIANLDPDKTVIYFKTAPGEENTEVKWLKDVDFESIQQIPEATRSYYESLIGTGELPFNHQFVPHLVYKGEVSIANTPVITLHDKS